jgi:hypothetical protein
MSMLWKAYENIFLYKKKMILIELIHIQEYNICHKLPLDMDIHHLNYDDNEPKDLYFCMLKTSSKSS